MFDFENLNECQKQAVLTTEGPVLIIAGPGTGKTFTLVKRIAYLVVEKGVNPDGIMVVTFTEKAAKELLTRISNEFIRYGINININEMYIGTFHSVALRILKENAELVDNDKNCRILDAFEQTYLVCRNIENFNMLGGFTKHIPSSMGVWNQALEICRYVNQLMEELVDTEAMEEDRDEDMRFLARLVKRYKELLERNNAMDFASIQTQTYEMLINHPEVLEKIQNSIRYIMVDEYQDTNYIQERLMFLLAGRKNNICVVGDDDQGMYRFRGATIRNILEFPSKFEDGICRVIHLNVNYRSEKGIVEFYNNWMDKPQGFLWDKYRYPKKITAGRKACALRSSVYSCAAESGEEEKEKLLQFVKTIKQNGNISDYNQVAFLFRSVKSEEAVAIAEYFEKNGIFVYSPRSDMFFERMEIKQILGCLMVCFQSYLIDLKKNNFNYKISDELREYYISCVRAANTLMKTDDNLHKFISEQAREIISIKEENNDGLLGIFYKLISFEPFCACLQARLDGNVNESRAARNLSEISRMLARFAFLHNMHSISEDNKLAMPEELFNIYIRYLYTDGIGEYEDNSEYAPSGCVSFMTVHQSKGLEFPVVIVGSLRNTPRKNTDSLMYSAESRFFNRRPYEPMADTKYFDFWRLYYTAFSRAQNLLILAFKDSHSKYFEDYARTLADCSAFDEKTIFERIKNIGYKRVYSFTSHIAVYDGCPTQYKFYKEYSFAQNKMFHTSVGSLVHATLEDMNNCIIDGQIERVNEEAIKKWFYLNYQTIREYTGHCLTEEQQENALQQVVRYYNHRKEKLGRVWKAEEEINLVLPEYILQGIIDLVEGEGDTVEIVDYKTGPKPDIEKYPNQVEHYRKQLEIYAYLIEKRYGKKVSKMNLYYTSTMNSNPIISFDWKKEAIEKTIEEITQTVKSIENKQFDKQVQNSYACDFCDMKYVCGKAFV